MEIRGPEGLGGARDIQPPRRAGKQGGREGASRSGSDQVEISNLGRFKGIVAAAPPIRVDRVAEIRQKIRKGGYPPQDLVDKAFDNMLSDETGA